MVVKKIKKILIVESDKIIARVMKLKLEKEDFEVESVFDGEEALNVLKKKKFDFVILDIVIPKIDGWKVLENIKKKKNKTLVIIFTELRQTVDQEKAKKLKADEYYIKTDTPIFEIIESVKRFSLNTKLS